MNKFVFVLLGVLLINTLTFAQQTKFNNTKVGNVYNIDFPEYMTRTYGLNNSASIQYHNAEKEAYTIVIDDEKEEIKMVGIEIKDLEGYYEFFMEGFKLDSSEIISKNTITINNLNAIQVEIVGSIDSTKIYYIITFVDSKEYYYNIISWTLYEFKESLINDYKKIAASLKE